MKIHIIGGSGSGKTTLSKKLAKKYNLKIYELDDFYWLSKKDYTLKATVPQMQKLYNSIGKQQNYLTEGCYYECIDELLDKSDKIIFLDPPFLVRLLRIYKRYFKTKLGLIKPTRKQTFSSTKKLAKQAKNFYPEYKKLVNSKLESYKNKITVLKTKKQINTFLNSL